jgi:hypothetical protein
MLIYGDAQGSFMYIEGMRIPLNPRQFGLRKPDVILLNTEGPPKPLTPEEQAWIDKNVVKDTKGLFDDKLPG